MKLSDTIICFKDMLSVEKCASIHTINSYVSDLQGFLDWLGNDQITKRSFIEYIQNKQYKTASIARKTAAISVWLKFCNTDLELNVALDLPKCAVRNRIPKVISRKDFDKIRDYLDSNPSSLNLQISAIIETLYSSGMRISELISVKYEQFQNIFQTKSLRIIGKGNKERIVFLNNIAIEKIRQYVENKKTKSQYLFSDNNGKQLVRQVINRWFRMVAKRAGVPQESVFPHSFRHRLGSDLNQRGMNLIEIKEILGHSNIKTTSIYTHFEDELLLELVKKSHPMGAL